MFHGSIEPAPAGESGLPALRKDIAELAAGLDARFVLAGTTLATAIETIDRVIGALDRVTSALDERAAGAAVGKLGAVAQRLAMLPEAQAVRQAELATVAATAGKLRAHVMEMHQALRVISIYGVNIKIAASGAEEFVSFADGMAAKLQTGQDQLDGFLSVLKALTSGVGSVRQAERQLTAECAKVVPEVPRRLAADAAELQAYLTAAAEVAQSVAAIARTVQGRVGIVLGALQVGDSTRQRLEHVVSALQMLDARIPQVDQGDRMHSAAAAHVHRLLVAQLEGLRADFEREAALLVGSLRDLGPEAMRLLSLIEEEADRDGRAFLQRLEAGIAEVERVTSQLHENDRRSRAMVGTITGSLDELAARLESVRRIRVDVSDIAVNTRLLCRRFGTAGKAVSVVAAEVDLYASRLGSELDCVVGPIRELGAVGSSIRQAQDDDGGLDAGEALREALGVIRDGCQRTERGVSEGRNDARQLIDVLRQTGEELADELALGDRIGIAAAMLMAESGSGESLPDATDPVLRTLLTDIASLYTMAQERTIHAQFLLPGMEPLTTAASASADPFDDDDDGLF